MVVIEGRRLHLESLLLDLLLISFDLVLLSEDHLGARLLEASCHLFDLSLLIDLALGARRPVLSLSLHTLHARVA